MKLLIDLQGAQAANARRGIGRYSVALADAIIRSRGSHQVHVLLNERFLDSTLELRQRFGGVLPADCIHSFRPMAAPIGQHGDAAWRSLADEALREAAIAAINPDVVLITSLFEGFADDAVVSVHSLDTGTPVAVVLYDLIPHLHPSVYLSDPSMRSWYDEKLAFLRRADLLLSISEATRGDALVHLTTPDESVVNISSAVEPTFAEPPTDLALSTSIARRLGLVRQFLMYAGGIDERKNIDRLLTAYAQLPTPLRAGFQLAIVCAVDDASRGRINDLCRGLGLNDDDVVLTGYVSDSDLHHLYHRCTAFVFPSWYEGFGLPVLEAMASGRAVVAANTSSIPEVIGREDALFDPFDTESIRGAIERVLVDTEFRSDLERTGRDRSQLFSWDLTAPVSYTHLTLPTSDLV